ncbi:MAG: stage II sporulation protein M [bacterium]|nr:stage II sporulation protein M [Candidatus Kapabacteria bacterium]
MREAAFQRQNSERWKHFEALLKERRDVDPDRLAELYVHVIDDLAYARTFYPESRTTTYLNALAVEIHQAIYRNKRERSSRIASFWKRELPQLFFEHRRELLYSLGIFVIAMAIGAVSALYDDSFIRLIMGDSYVNMTLENIRKGDPMAVYKGDGELDMFFTLTFHNIRVAMSTFVYGLMFSIGTVYSLMMNGIMLGAFEAFCYQQGVFAKSALSIWIHGVIEISAIVIAGCAGLVMGNGFLFPGTYTRMQSFRNGARRGLKIMIGLVPFFVVAGFLESFITRYTSMPVPLSLAIIATSIASIAWYVVIYPQQLYGKRSHRAST